MDEAILVFSRKGALKTAIKARDIKSREDARKLWPFVTKETPHKFVTWVSPTFTDGILKRRSHFRSLPSEQTKSLREHIQDEARSWQASRESAHHMSAKELLRNELQERLDSNRQLIWSFKDPRSSDFHFEGDLLFGAERIETEWPLHTPFGMNYRLDVGILGKVEASGERSILGGIEVEHGHAFDGFKALIGKSMAFPLISIDISETPTSELTREWAQDVVSATTLDHALGYRKTYVYLHDLLYPQFVRLPGFNDKEHRHQFVIFASDETLGNLERSLKMFAKEHGYSQKDVAIMSLNARNEQALTTLRNDGEVIGNDWSSFNDHRCLRISLDRPIDSKDQKSHFFHSYMARILLAETDLVVGYRYRNLLPNNRPEEDLWTYREFKGGQLVGEHRLLPKRLAEPIGQLIKLLDALKLEAV